MGMRDRARLLTAADQETDADNQAAAKDFTMGHWTSPHLRCSGYALAVRRPQVSGSFAKIANRQDPSVPVARKARGNEPPPADGSKSSFYSLLPSIADCATVSSASATPETSTTSPASPAAGPHLKHAGTVAEGGRFSAHPREFGTPFSQRSHAGNNRAPAAQHRILSHWGTCDDHWTLDSFLGRSLADHHGLLEQHGTTGFGPGHQLAATRSIPGHRCARPLRGRRRPRHRHGRVLAQVRKRPVDGIRHTGGREAIG